MDDDLVAQFMAVTSCEAATAHQYLEASNLNLEQAVELFFASGGASIESQLPSAPQDNHQDDVRERIEGFDDQLVDEEAQMFNEAMRNSRRAEMRARKPRSIFNQGRDAELNDQGLSKHERRLANLFRPPFDIISDLTLDEAKEQAQESRKLIMVNIQDSGEFACQRLNRDLWRSEHVKQIVHKNFVFLQYDSEDPDGEDYRVLYPFEIFPHIAILDPWTGEQQKAWHKVPGEAEFIEDIVDFVAEVQDGLPHSEGAETAVEPAPASTSSSTAEPSIKAASGTTAPTTSQDSESATPASTTPHIPTPAARAEQDPVALIEPSDEPEPPQGPNTTRVQLRYGDGKRTVRRFLLEDPVTKVYAVVKHVLGAQDKITLTSERRELKTELGKTIEEANLKNSTVLVEIE